jgi:putative transcriptional regulator
MTDESRTIEAEEVETMSKLGKRLIQAAQEARAIARGKADPSTCRVHVPAEIDVKAIRTRLRLSQSEFARRFGIPPGTLRDWEQHRRRPEGPARVLLVVIDQEPEAVNRALARKIA